MKTREYEFEGRRYRWKCFPRPGSGNDLHIYHQHWHSHNGDWCSCSTPSTPAAASALAALIEDMQVQVTDLEERNAKTERVAAVLIQAKEALRLTKEYVEPKVALPAIEGWSWYDATVAIDKALAALIEDMQVQVIAEWEWGCSKYRARGAGAVIIVETWDRHREEWSQIEENTATFRAGYEAGKAAR